MSEKICANCEADDELVRKALTAPEGDLRAFEQLVQHHRQRIVADCRYMTRDNDNAEDLAQEIFVKAFLSLRRFERRSSFRQWLQRIKFHHCLNYLKKQEGKRHVSVDDNKAEQSEQLHISPSVYQHFETMDERQRVANVLESLPSTLRIPLIMRDMDNLSYKEVAAGLGIGLSATKMRIKRAREEFRRRYQAGPAKS